MTKAAAALLLLAGWHLGAAQEVDPCGPATNTDYQYEAIPTTGFTIRWTIDTSEESISFQVVSAAAAWTSVGFSSDGMMVGSDAVVGLPDDVSVQEYDLTGLSIDQVDVSDVQEITGGSVSQDASGETTLTFTRPLSPEGDKQTISSTPGDTTILLYSFGIDNTLAYHGPAPSRGSVVLDLFCGNAGTFAGTPAPSASTSSAPVGGRRGDETPAPSISTGGGGGRGAGTTAPTTPGGGGGGGRGTVTAAPTTPGGGGGGRGAGTTAPTTPGSGGGGGGRGTVTAAPTTPGGGGRGRGTATAAPTTPGGGGGGQGAGTAAPTTPGSGGGGRRGTGTTAPTTPSVGGGGRGAGTAAPTTPVGGGGGGRGAGTAAPTTPGGGGGGRGSGTASPATPGGGEPDTATPAPSPENGDRGVVLPDEITTSPTVNPDVIPTTEAPSNAGDAGGQGDSDGASRGGERGWVVMAATGIVTVLVMRAL